MAIRNHLPERGEIYVPHFMLSAAERSFAMELGTRSTQRDKHSDAAARYSKSPL